MANKPAPKPKPALGNKPGPVKKTGSVGPRPARPGTGMTPDRSKQVQSFLKKYSVGAQ